MIEYRKTLKSHNYNEDRFVSSKYVYGVIDGATVLKGETAKNRKTSASILSAFVKSQLEKFSGGDIAEYVKNLSVLCYEKGFTPASCGIALAVVGDKDVVFYSVGDCEIAFKTKDGKIENIKQHELTELDDGAIRLLKSIAREKNISVKAARPLINDLLIRNRDKKNKPNGYSVFEPMKIPTFNPIVLTVDKSTLDRAIIFTDGFASCFSEIGIIKSYENLFDDGVDVIGLCKRISDELKSDAEYNKYPRFKLVDDITVSMLVF